MHGLRGNRDYTTGGWPVGQYDGCPCHKQMGGLFTRYIARVSNDKPSFLFFHGDE